MCSADIHCLLVVRLIIAHPAMNTIITATGTLEQQSLSQDSKCSLHLKIALMLSTLSPL